MPPSRFITRKEIADVNEVSDDTIERREKEIGLHTCRDRACERPIRYHRARAAEKLRRRGMNVPGETTPPPN